MSHFERTTEVVDQRSHSLVRQSKSIVYSRLGESGALWVGASLITLVTCMHACMHKHTQKEIDRDMDNPHEYRLYAEWGLLKPTPIVKYQFIDIASIAMFLLTHLYTSTCYCRISRLHYTDYSVYVCLCAEFAAALKCCLNTSFHVVCVSALCLYFQIDEVAECCPLLVFIYLMLEKLTSVHNYLQHVPSSFSLCVQFFPMQRLSDSGDPSHQSLPIHGNLRDGRSDRFRCSFALTFVFLVCVCAVVVLFLPTVESQGSSLPDYLHVSLQSKLVAAFVLGKSSPWLY